MMKKEKIKVLFFVDRMRVGGIQILLMNLFRHFDMQEINCELLVLDDGIHYDLEDKLVDYNVKLHKLERIWIRKPLDYIKYAKAVDKFFTNNHDYDVVHMNSSSKNYMILKYAKKHDIPIRIAHSHNTGFQSKSKSQIIIGDILKKPLKKYATDYMACSEYAGEWLFGKKAVEEGKVIVLPNGIDLDKFKYNETIRKKYRDELKIQDKTVIGNVGRFTNQKNHLFLIDIFNELYHRDNNTVLLLAGIGEKQDECIEKVKRLGIQDAVIFLGFRNDVMNLTQAMDIFLMPSLYEGFPVTGIEAQAVGLPCVFADTITREVKMIDEVKFISLDASISFWCDNLLEFVGVGDREKSYEKIKNKGFDISDVVNKLIKIYRK